MSPAAEGGGGDLLRELEESAKDLLRQATGSQQVKDLKEALLKLEEGGGADRRDAEVITAVPLTGGEREQLESRLRARHGDDLSISYRTDPAILGGVVVRVGDRLIDGSVSAKLGQLRQTLTGAGGSDS